MPRFRSPRSWRLRLFAMITLTTVYYLYSSLSDFDHSAKSYDTRPPSPPSSRINIGNDRNSPKSKIQYQFRENGVEAGDLEKMKAVVDTMKKTFWGYRLRAWGSDEIMPVSGESQTTRNGWAATIVDTLTTTALMGLEEEFTLELNYTITAIDFNNAKDLVDPFETVIRYLGALVSAIELFDAGILPKHLSTSVNRKGLLSQALTLATKLGPGFDSPTGMMWPRVDFAADKGCAEPMEERSLPDYPNPIVGPARTGSNWLEYKVLSKITGDTKYENNATKAWRPLVWNRFTEEWPGLIDSPLDITTGEPVDGHRSWGAGHDSYYEYLIKAHILAPNDKHSRKYRNRWLQAVESTMKHLASRSSPTEGQTTGKLFLSQWRNGWILNEMGHLACFAGGNFLLGGKYLGRQDILQFGLDVVDTCHETYVKSLTQIGPEYFNWIPAYSSKPTFEPQNDAQWEQLDRAGFWATDGRWMLRPETVESYFYAYRITGDKKYQEWAWDAYSAFVNTAKADFGFAEVLDVNRPAGPDNLNDKSESFWGAETLKYLYLTFTNEDVGSLDEWVFSTEAHPFRIMR